MNVNIACAVFGHDTTIQFSGNGDRPGWETGDVDDLLVNRPVWRRYCQRCGDDAVVWGCEGERVEAAPE